ncbi:helix-turn-helix protein [Sinorhizobium sp. KGO-5]|uniref:helix-turn-helix domain-containing protein n=1 Tax=Sinorhizobium sp. KGO-5 TaxID=1470810 RepID=UPI002948E7E4|nr:helix-turn-helix protein [Sinorhizobium sp. KGO-5]
MSQGALGEIVRVTNRQIEQYEVGPARVSARRLLLIADALQVPATYFLNDRYELYEKSHPGPSALNRNLFKLQPANKMYGGIASE